MRSDEDSSYGYSAFRCEFSHILRELESMAGTDVNAVVELGDESGREVLRAQGRLGLAESVVWGGQQKWLRYSIGEAGAKFSLWEEDFVDGKLVPGRIWAEMASMILTVERRHFPPELSSDETDGSTG